MSLKWTPVAPPIADGIVGVPVKSEYAPDVATVARDGVPDKSEYAPDVATVAKVV